MPDQQRIRQTASHYRAEHLRLLNSGGCDALMRQGSKSFYAASRLLPVVYRLPVFALYAFCRVTDDEVDGSDQINLVSGRTGVAGSVGAMMALIMGVREPWAMARACELGVAMQLTNIARDVGEDAAMGRCYLPRQWMRQEGIDPVAWLRRPEYLAGVGRVVSRLLTYADGLYARAEQGISALPRGCRPAIFSARTIYADIGRSIARVEFNSVDHRAVVSKRQKLVRVLQAMPSYLLAPAWRRGHPPLESVKFLVEAALPSMAVIAPKTLSDKAGWMIDLLLELERRERALSSASSGHSPGQHPLNSR
ncbi:MAG: phytoene/squalene synthase family protein [Betaproteobacteria bacterium]|nr:phytoene/squalene synthase family protein [Betaproteobacteria bacterium]